MRVAVTTVPRHTVMHILAPAAAGGLEQVVRTLAAGQARRGHEVHVVPVVSERGHPFMNGWSTSGAQLHPVIVHARAYMEERRTIRSLARRLRADIAHTHGYRSDLVDAPVARRLGIHTVTTVHGFTGGGIRNGVYEALQRRSFRRFDAVIAVSRALHTDIVSGGVPLPRVHLVPNGFDTSADPLSREEARARLGLPRDGLVAGWVGRLSREKGPDVFLNALRLVTDVPLTAAVIGEGPMLPELRAAAEAAGLSGRIRWLGRIEDAATLFAAFDMFVLSSRTEGTPITLFEAMAAEVPIIAAAVGGVPDVLPAGEAILVPAGQPESLAQAMRDTVRNRTAAVARTRTARTRLTDAYGMEAWLDHHDRVYDAITGAEMTAPGPQRNG